MVPGPAAHQLVPHPLDARDDTRPAHPAVLRCVLVPAAAAPGESDVAHAAGPGGGQEEYA